MQQVFVAIKKCVALKQQRILFFGGADRNRTGVQT